MTMKYEDKDQKKSETNDEMLWGGSFSYIKNYTYIFNINQQLRVMIQAGNVNVAYVLFADGNNNLMPIPPSFLLNDDTNQQIVPPNFRFFYSIVWQCDYTLSFGNQEVFALRNQRQQAVLRGPLGLNYQVI